MIQFPKIPQLRTALGDITVAGEVRLVGTTKLHGTNAAISFHNGTITYQSRNRVLKVGDDNHGFAAHMSQFEDTEKYGLGLKALLSLLNERGYSFKTAEGPTTFFGEWCGRGIMKGMGVNELDKMFVIFGVLVGDEWVPMDHWALVTSITKRWHKERTNL